MRIFDTVKVDNNYALIIEDFYDTNRYKEVLEECIFLSNHGLGPEETSSARDSNTHEYLKKNKAVWISNFFKEFSDSTIGKSAMHGFTRELLQTFEQIDPFYHYYFNINYADCLVSYYEDSDWYKPHRDSAVITQLTWLYEEPKAFKGGNLILRDANNNIIKEIECIPNRSVIFPSYMIHEVIPISMEKEDIGKKKGRFTISTFNNIIPQ